MIFLTWQTIFHLRHANYMYTEFINRGSAKSFVMYKWQITSARILALPICYLCDLRFNLILGFLIYKRNMIITAL